MRSENSVKNSLFAIVGQAVSLIFGFITRRQFIIILGEEYLGINGVFCSVLALLSLTELGLGSVMTYALYKPIAEKDNESTGRILNLYALAYRVVAIAITLLGLCLIPFIGLITDNVAIPNIIPIYLLYLANTSVSYLFSYRRALITAAEQDYKNSIITSATSIAQNVLQLVVLVVTGDFILYLTIQILCTLFSNLSISLLAKRMFSTLGKVKGIPDRESVAEIITNVKAMFMSRFGSIAVTGTDNLLIASIGVGLAGIYSNYLLLLQTIQTILGQVINAVTASVGNLIALDMSDRRLEVYKNIIFATHWLYGFSAIALDCLMTRFITLFFGDGLEIAEFCVHIMCINFYLSGVRQPNQMYINAAGLFKSVKYRGFVEAAVNLGISAIFLYLDMGLFGILLGTTVSHISTGIWWEAWCVSKYSLDSKSTGSFYLLNLAFSAVLAVAWVATRFVVSLPGGGLAGFVISVLIVALIPNLLFLVIYHAIPEMAFFKGVIIRILGKYKKV